MNVFLKLIFGTHILFTCLDSVPNYNIVWLSFSLYSYSFVYSINWIRYISNCYQDVKKTSFFYIRFLRLLSPCLMSSCTYVFMSFSTCTDRRGQTGDPNNSRYNGHRGRYSDPVVSRDQQDSTNHTGHKSIRGWGSVS